MAISVYQTPIHSYWTADTTPAEQKKAKVRCDYCGELTSDPKSAPWTGGKRYCRWCFWTERLFYDLDKIKEREGEKVNAP